MSNPTGDALKAYRDGLVITDEYRARNVSADFILCGPDGKDIQIWADGHVVGWEGVIINRLPVVRYQIEQDTARKAAKILDNYADRIATACANGNENDVKFLRKMAGVQRAAFNIKD